MKVVVVVVVVVGDLLSLPRAPRQRELQHGVSWLVRQLQKDQLVVLVLLLRLEELLLLKHAPEIVHCLMPSFQILKALV
jgi:hypothetical protein